MKNLFVFILAGGSGERFWPKSRKNFPKQILPIFTKRPMIQETISRVRPLAGGNTFVLTNEKFKQAMKEKGIRAKSVVEPQPKNTAAAIGLASIHALHLCPDAILMVMPSDHYIEDVVKFRNTLKKIVYFVGSNRAIVTLGIKPNYPAVSYGYIKPADLITAVRGTKFYKVSKFIEKPRREVADKLFRKKTYLWNAGMFIFKAKDMLDELKVYMPKLHRGLMMISDCIGKPGYKKVLSREFKRFDDISIDYALMEKTKIGCCSEGDFGWDDVGLWSNIEKFHFKDGCGNVTIGKFCGLDSEDNIVVSTKDHLVATCAIKGHIIIHTEDATLVCHKEKAEEVKLLVNLIKRDKRLRRYL